MVHRVRERRIGVKTRRGANKKQGGEMSKWFILWANEWFDTLCKAKVSETRFWLHTFIRGWRQIPVETRSPSTECTGSSEARVHLSPPYLPYPPHTPPRKARSQTSRTPTPTLPNQRRDTPPRAPASVSCPPARVATRRRRSATSSIQNAPSILLFTRVETRSQLMVQTHPLHF